MAKTNQSHHIRFKDAVETTKTISTALIARESELNDTKWFGYRFTSPWQATIRFMEVYNELLRQAVRSSIDARLAKTVRGISIADFKRDPRIRTQLWCARQRADDVGMRYEEYIGASFGFALRRQRKVLPQPNQLHHGENAQQWWIQFRNEFWEERLRHRVVPLPDDPAYRVEHFRELPAQVAYRTFLLAMADQSTTPRGRSCKL